jgi:hypothetical protein
LVEGYEARATNLQAAETQRAEKYRHSKTVRGRLGKFARKMAGK